MKEYNKLVRDRIPEILEKLRKRHEIRELNHDEICGRLLDKLVEEAQEAQEIKEGLESGIGDHVPSLILELADLTEVIDAILGHLEIDRDILRFAQDLRREQRGGFEKRILLKFAEK